MLPRIFIHRNILDKQRVGWAWEVGLPFVSQRNPFPESNLFPGYKQVKLILNGKGLGSKIITDPGD